MREAIRTQRAPAAIGPYSQAIRTGDLLWCSGQIGLDPATGNLVEGGFEAEARQVMANLEAVVGEAGMTLANAVKLTVYVVDLVDFPKLNEIMSKAFSEPFPARATVQVEALPRGARVEIDLVAARS